METGPKVILEVCHEGRHIIETYPINTAYWTGVGVLSRIKNIVSVTALKKEQLRLSAEIETDKRILDTDLATLLISRISLITAMLSCTH